MVAAEAQLLALIDGNKNENETGRKEKEKKESPFQGERRVSLRFGSPFSSAFWHGLSLRSDFELRSLYD